MSEDREPVDEVEALVVVWERRHREVLRGRREQQILLAPLDEFGVGIAAVKARAAYVLPVAKDPAAAASPVQNCLEFPESDTMAFERFEDERGAHRPVLQEHWIGNARSRHQHLKLMRR
jgi:hypothetical protein